MFLLLEKSIRKSMLGRELFLFLLGLPSNQSLPEKRCHLRCLLRWQKKIQAWDIWFIYSSCSSWISVWRSTRQHFWRRHFWLFRHIDNWNYIPKRKNPRINWSYSFTQRIQVQNIFKRPFTHIFIRLHRYLLLPGCNWFNEF